MRAREVYVNLTCPPLLKGRAARLASPFTLGADISRLWRRGLEKGLSTRKSGVLSLVSMPVAFLSTSLRGGTRNHLTDITQP